MKKIAELFLLVLLLSVSKHSFAQDGLVPKFELDHSRIELNRLAQPFTPFDKVGRKFAVLGYESGTFEAWAYPLKILRNFTFSFFLENSTRPIKAEDIVKYVSVDPASTTLTYVYQSFTVKATFITPMKEPATMIMLSVNSVVPLKIVCGFLPVLQPMWPAGLGGQYAYWDDDMKAYIISEPTGQNHGIVGSPAASGISYAPAHMLSDYPYEFNIEVKNPATVVGKYIPIYITGGKGKWDSVKVVYDRIKSDPEKYYSETVRHYRDLLNNTMQVTTPNEKINMAFEWAKVAYDNLVVKNPDLGEGLVAGLGMSGTSGRPGFGWFFGGDAFINSFSLNSFGDFHTVRDALAFTQKWQRADGKMAHELSQAAGYVDWFGKYPYAYIHGDTTPFYIDAMYDYYKMTGDKGFVKESWKSLKKAYDWCLMTDVNGDGLMDNKKAGLGALEFGALIGIESDVYLSAIWVRATYAMKFLAGAVDDTLYQREAERDFAKAERAFNEKFWDSKNKYYSYAFNAKGELVSEITPWNTVALTWGIGDPQRSVESLERLSTSELTTDWGVRSISDKSKYYDPLNYNYGTVWPFITSWASTAEFAHKFGLQGYGMLMASVRHTFDNELGDVTEVFSGATNIPLGEAVPHQGFSTAGVVMPLVRGLLGLDGNAIEKKVTFAPLFPANWENVEVRNYKIGGASFDFMFHRSKSEVEIKIDGKNMAGYTSYCAPAFGIGTTISSVSVNGKTVEYNLVKSSEVVQPDFDVPLDNKTVTIAIECQPAVEILPPKIETYVGAPNKGLKIISMQLEGSTLRLDVEGLSGKEYELDIVNPEKVEKVVGAAQIGNTLKIPIPDDNPGKFVRHEIVITEK